MAAFSSRLSTACLMILLSLPAGPLAADPPSWSGAWPVRERFHRSDGDGGDVVYALPPPPVGAAVAAAEGAAAIPVARGLPFGFNRGTCDRALLEGASARAVALPGAVGRAMDATDRECVWGALEALPDSRSIAWVGEAGELFRIAAERTYMVGEVHCRDWRASLSLAGRLDHTSGTMCRRSDGQWVSAN
ncbi:MAG: hypothetical protein NVV74_15005 [Magnetospirillum sp.]|nr:hypothetical protein [Magnetospirillum sp.]